MKCIFLPEAGLFLLLVTLLPGVAFFPDKPPAVVTRAAALQTVYASDRQIGALAAAPGGRLFFNYSRWFGPVPVAVVELKNGQPVAFPDAAWSQETAPVSRHFFSVQSVYADGRFLWIVDAANPQMQGLVPGGAKLVKVDLGTGGAVQTIRFDPVAAPAGSYLNDVRVDRRRNRAYLSDLGLGALLVVDLSSGKTRRVLTSHPSTKSEEITMQVNGKPWLMPDGTARRVHVTGLALDPQQQYLYYKSLTGRRLYRIATRWLHEPAITEAELGRKVEFVAEVGGTDSMDFGPDGYLYLTAFEQNAISRYRPGGAVEVVVQDKQLSWPRSIAFSEGQAYVSTYRLHEGDQPTDRYKIFRFTLPRQ
jgi:sugar lactone lactonase YvrE